MSQRDLVLVISLALMLGSCTVETRSSTVTSGASSSGAATLPVPGSTTALSSTSSPSPSKVPSVVSLLSLDQVAFVSPTGNITCLMVAATASAAAYARCDIADSTFAPPAKPAGCQYDWGNSLMVTTTAAFGCVGDSVDELASISPQNQPGWFLAPYDTVYTARGTDSAALGYGRALVLGQLRCESERTGVTCDNTETDAGFLVSRAAYTLTPPSGRRAAPRRVDVAGVLAGEWDGHGRHLVVQDDGTVQARYRTYQDCAAHPTPPCDGGLGNAIVLGGAVLMQLEPVSAGASGTAVGHAVVTSSTDPGIPVGSHQDLELKDGIITWAGGTYCGPNSQGDSPCGA